MLLPSLNFRSPLQGSNVVGATIPRALPRADIDHTVGVAWYYDFTRIHPSCNRTIKKFLTVQFGSTTFQKFQTVQIQQDSVIKNFLNTATNDEHNSPLYNPPLYYRNTSTNLPLDPDKSITDPNGVNFASLGQRPRTASPTIPVALKGRPKHTDSDQPITHHSKGGADE